ncbi:hypothetical protein [Effusibacillus consociatus]|uniref:Uncharacterized protein n=1 Tax=Effusibacillus consociatus TaxID=1117041 RepID=A0ABV9PV22_9BACL
MKRSVGIAVSALLAFFCLFQAAPASALSFDENQAILVIAPGLSWETISPDRTPHLFQMMQSGGAANMTLPFRGNDETGYLAVKSGGRGTADSSALLDAITESGGRVATIGQTTDYNQLYNEYLSLSEHTNFLIVEPAKLMSLTAKRNAMSTVQLQKEYMNELTELDRFIGKLLNVTDRNHLLIVANPVSFAEGGIGYQPAGVVLMDGGGVEPNSLLASNSTRHEGIVTTFDIAPTVLSHLGLSPYIKGGLGQGIGSIPSEIPSQLFLRNQIQNLTLLNEFRPYLVKGYVCIMIFLLITAAGFRLLNLRKPRWVDHSLTGFLALPAVYLVYPLLGFSPPREMVIKLILLLALTWTCLAFLRTLRTRLLAISSVAVGLILFDMLRQGRLMKFSAMGYDLLGGARFYGIGNEYMGIGLGASLLVYFLLQKQYPHHLNRVRILGGIGFAAMTYLLAAPQFGTNAGGALAAALTYLYVVVTEARVPIFKNRWMWVFGGTLLALGGMSVLNAAVSPADQTHIGRAVTLLLGGEFGEFKQMAIRKWAMNWWLLDVSVWGKLFLAVLMLLMLDLLRPNLFRGLPEGTTSGSIAPCFLVGGTSVFLLNDSGVLAAAGLMVFGAVGILTQAVMEERIVTDTGLQDEMLKERTS